MATIHDVMPAFELFQPTSIDDALSLLERHRRSVWVLAGGLDTFDWLKDRNKRPQVVIDLSGVEALRGIKTLPDGGLEIGATTTLTEIANNAVIKEKFKLLSDAAALVASPQIRNQGTLGGNISQDTRCWYYRSGWTCYRAGGNICYADTPTSINREHALVRRQSLRGGEPVRHGAGARGARGADGDPQLERRASRARRRVLHRAVDRHHAHDGDGAGRPVDRDPHSGHVGRSEVLLREGPRPPGLGFPAGERGVGGQGVGRQHSAGAHRRERRRRAPDAAAERSKSRWRARRRTKKPRRWPGSWRYKAPSLWLTTATRSP